MIKIKYGNLVKFQRLHDEVNRQFGSGLISMNNQIRLETRDRALQFIRENGFNIDDKIEWVTWDNKKDYMLSLLKWS